MEDNYTRITNKTFAIVFTVLAVTTLVGIIFKGAYWHIPTLIITGVLAIAFWVEHNNNPKDNSPI